MAKKTTVLVPIKREGENGSVRAKIPAGLIKQLGGDDGDVIQFELHRDTLVGASILTGKEAKQALKEREAELKEAAKSKKPAAKKVATPTKSAKPAKSKGKSEKVSKKVKGEAPKISKGKKEKPGKKGSNRKTSVAYESAKPKKKLSLKKKK